MSGWEEGLRNAGEAFANPALRWIGAAVVVLAVLAWLSLRQTRSPKPPPPPPRLHPDPVVDAALQEKARRERDAKARQEAEAAAARESRRRFVADIRAGRVGICPLCRMLAPTRAGIVVESHLAEGGWDASRTCRDGIGERALPADHLIG
jgi:hypothetical protein